MSEPVTELIEGKRPYTVLKRCEDGLVLFGCADGTTGMATQRVVEARPEWFKDDALKAPERDFTYRVPRYVEDRIIAASDPLEGVPIEETTVVVTPRVYDICGRQVEAGYSPELRVWIVA